MTDTKKDLYGADLSGVRWRKSSHSNPDNCVEVARLGALGVAVRDSKNPTKEPLRFTPGEWDAFVKGAADKEF